VSSMFIYTLIPFAKNIVTFTPIARQRVGKQVLAKTDSW
jgi:hypothetical protein